MTIHDYKTGSSETLADQILQYYWVDSFPDLRECGLERVHCKAGSYR